MVLSSEPQQLLFNIVEAGLKKKLNFNVCVVQTQKSKGETSKVNPVNVYFPFFEARNDAFEVLIFFQVFIFTPY